MGTGGPALLRVRHGSTDLAKRGVPLGALRGCTRRLAGVAIEIYHDAKHAWNVRTMLDTAKTGLGLFSREYAPYPASLVQDFGVSALPDRGPASPGGVAYSESAGFLTDLHGATLLDYTTAHELAHQWWGGLIYGARMQGRQMLNETMAQYSTLMVFKQQEDPEWLRRMLAATHSNYLDGSSRENVGEQPLIYTEDQGNISYNKGALVMFALQDLIGADRMHRACAASSADSPCSRRRFPFARPR